MDKQHTKTFIITGAASGLGREIGMMLIEKGHRGVFVDVNGPGDDLKSFIERHAGEVEFFQQDIKDIRAMEELIRLCYERFGRIDMLVNNAALKVFEPFECLSDDLCSESYKVNVLAPMQLCRLVLPYMKSQRRGYIVNIASRSGLRGYADGSLYCGTKAALIAFSESLSKEVIGTGLHVYALCPTLLDPEDPLRVNHRKAFAESIGYDRVCRVVESIILEKALPREPIVVIFSFSMLLKILAKTFIRCFHWICQYIAQKIEILGYKR